MFTPVEEWIRQVIDQLAVGQDVYLAPDSAPILPAREIHLETAFASEIPAAGNTIHIKEGRRRSADSRRGCKKHGVSVSGHSRYRRKNTILGFSSEEKILGLVGMDYPDERTESIHCFQRR